AVVVVTAPSAGFVFEAGVTLARLPPPQAAPRASSGTESASVTSPMGRLRSIFRFPNPQTSSDASAFGNHGRTSCPCRRFSDFSDKPLAAYFRERYERERHLVFRRTIGLREAGRLSASTVWMTSAGSSRQPFALGEGHDLGP